MRDLAGPWTRMRVHPGVLGLALLTLLTTGCATKGGAPMGGKAEFMAMRYRPATPLPAPDTGAARKNTPPVHGARTGEGGHMGLVTRSVMGGLQAHESMGPRAARYQEQISGRPASEAYWVGGKDHKSGGVRFDGFEDGVLLETQG